MPGGEHGGWVEVTSLAVFASSTSPPLLLFLFVVVRLTLGVYLGFGRVP